MSAPIEFFVPGIPAPGGSKRFVGFGKRTGRAILIDAAGQRNKDWRSAVGWAAREVFKGELLRGPLSVRMSFIMPRPKAHFHQGKKRKGELREDAPQVHTSKPDALKLGRSTEDALTGIVWADDSQTCELTLTKRYGTPGCSIVITPL